MALVGRLPALPDAGRAGPTSSWSCPDHGVGRAAVAAQRGVLRRVRRAPGRHRPLPDLPAVAAEPGLAGHRLRRRRHRRPWPGHDDLRLRDLGAGRTGRRARDQRGARHRPRRSHRRHPARRPRHRDRRGPPTVRVRIDSQIDPAVAGLHHAAAGEWDRSVVAGEADGRWLWLVLRPASAIMLLRDDWILRDVSGLGPPLVELPFGGPAAGLVTRVGQWPERASAALPPGGVASQVDRRTCPMRLCRAHPCPCPRRSPRQDRATDPGRRARRLGPPRQPGPVRQPGQRR